MSEVPLSQWRDFVNDVPEAHLLQTGEWGELKSSFGWDAVRLIGDGIGAQVLFRNLPLGLCFGYVPKGPVGRANDRAARQHWDEIASICRRRHAVFLKIEPDAWDDNEEILGVLASTGSTASPHSIQPRRTIIVDLRGGEPEILGRMKPKCRYNIGLAARKGVTIQPWGDIAAFHGMMQATGQRDGFGIHSVDYMKRAYELFRASGTVELLAAMHADEPLAGLMAFRRGRRAWYLYGASTDEARELMPNYLLQWEAMRWAKQNGCEEYDLWGVPDEDEAALEAGFQTRHDGLWGVYRFKRGFGGEVRRAAQAQDWVFQPLLYSLYRRRATGQSIA
jgi:peptidoglycan pentaglycine glycine transferase (the first glycine)